MRSATGVVWLGGAVLLLVASPVAAGDSAEATLRRRMAVTIDDLPQNSRIGTAAHRLAINERLLRTLVDERIPAVGFVNASKCYQDGEPIDHQMRILRAWVDAGLELGNHTWSHPDLRGTELAAFFADIEQGEPLLREVQSERALRWFRHPFLFRGDTDAKREALQAHLRERGYREAPVSIDNGEWIYAVAYDLALIDEDLDRARRIGEDYARYMLDAVRFWEGQSHALFGRNIDHVLLIHANTINADHLGTLVEALRALGYTFTTLEHALEDPAYQSEDRYSGRAGISWLHRWALTRDVDHAIFAGEPDVPEWVREDAGY